MIFKALFIGFLILLAVALILAIYQIKEDLISRKKVLDITNGFIERATTVEELIVLQQLYTEIHFLDNEE